MKIGLYLMTTKGHRVLRAAFDYGVPLAHVTTADATGMNDDSHRLIARECKERGVPVFTLAHPPEFTGDWSIAAGWRRMLDVPNLVVLHDSLLPRYRGFSPLITARVQGDTEIGVTAFLARDEPDTGPVIAQEAITVGYPMKMRQVLDKIEPLYERLAEEVFFQLSASKCVHYVEQDHSRATYSLFRDEQDYWVDWSKGAPAIRRLVDAVSDPFPGAETMVQGVRARVFGAEVEPDVVIEDRVPGKLFRIDQGQPIVVCGEGLIRITAIRRDEGPGMLPWERHKVRFE